MSATREDRERRIAELKTCLGERWPDGENFIAEIDHDGTLFYLDEKNVVCSHPRRYATEMAERGRE